MKNQLNLLKRLGAPQELIDSFIEVCRINSLLPEDARSDFSALLEEQCRKFGFNSILLEGWFFRPYGSSGTDHRSDRAVNGNETEAPAIEQAYRRGVSQGFSICRELVSDKKTSDIEKQEKKIDRWRRRSIQRFGSFPGSEERPPRKLFGGRNSISLSLRWKVFERDNNRCKICGKAAADGVTLEVDHKMPVSKGGLDSLENLQTLCNLCNRGKSDC